MQKIDINIAVSIEDIENLLCSAFEGGSNYWAEVKGKRAPAEWTYFGDYNEKKTKYLHLYPLNGGGVMIQDIEENGSQRLEKPAELNQAKLKKGLQIMAQEYPKHFSSILTDDTDAETGDVFLQCCLFGEIIYG